MGQNLIDLITLTGPAGTNGTNGTNGVDGKEVEFNTTLEYIQWRYVGDSTWINLVNLSTLAGLDGRSYIKS